jgi:hypothetical protein
MWANIVVARANNLTDKPIETTALSRPMLTFLLWCLLLFLCWPLAIAVLLIYPLVWLVLLPFRLIGLTFDAIFETLHAVLSLPARVARKIA